jgi:hypothetical protein
MFCQPRDRSPALAFHLSLTKIFEGQLHSIQFPPGFWHSQPIWHHSHQANDSNRARKMGTTHFYFVSRSYANGPFNDNDREEFQDGSTIESNRSFSENWFTVGSPFNMRNRSRCLMDSNTLLVRFLSAITRIALFRSEWFDHAGPSKSGLVGIWMWISSLFDSWSKKSMVNRNIRRWIATVHQCILGPQKNREGIYQKVDRFTHSISTFMTVRVIYQPFYLFIQKGWWFTKPGNDWERLLVIILYCPPRSLFARTFLFAFPVTLFPFAFFL